MDQYKLLDVIRGEHVTIDHLPFLHLKKRCHWIFGFLILLFGSMTARASTPEPLPFQVGEKLTYHLYWGMFMVGRSTFEVLQNEDGDYVFNVKVKSNSFISNIFPIDDVLTSVFDVQNKKTLRLLEDRKEGKRVIWDETFFDYKLGKANIQSYISEETRSFDIPLTGIQDKVSLVYYMRTLSWRDREEASAMLANVKGNAEVAIKKIKTETLKSDDFSPIHTLKLEPSTENLTGFLRKGKVWVWVSDDQFQIPVRLAGKVAFGTVSAVLVDVDGVKDWPYATKN